MEAVQHIPLEDREAFKYALAATLVKNHAHWKAFETVFEVYFSLRGPEYGIGDGDEQVDSEFRPAMPGSGDDKRGGGGLEGMSKEQLAEMLYRALMNADEALMRAIAKQALTRKLAVRLARKRRHGRKGPLDFRNTMRHSLSYGGVPAEPKFRYPRPAKPEIIVIADISGSVAAFARFTLQLVYAISSQFSKVRSFVFIDGVDEVTSYFEGIEDITEAVHRVNTEADVIWVDGHSDYGHAFETLWERWGKEISTKTSVILLGDARNNYHAPQSWVVQEMRKRARHVYWLNPEPHSYWDTGDSIVSEY